MNWHGLLMSLLILALNSVLILVQSINQNQKQTPLILVIKQRKYQGLQYPTLSHLLLTPPPLLILKIISVSKLLQNLTPEL